MIALAADLASLTARVVGAAALAEQARALRRQAEEVGRADGEAYAAFLAGRREEAREQTIALPARMAQLAAEAAELAAEAAATCSGPARYDAAAGALLAEGAARVARLLVQANLSGAADPRAAGAAQAVERAEEAAKRALAATLLASSARGRDGRV